MKHITLATLALSIFTVGCGIDLNSQHTDVQANLNGKIEIDSSSSKFSGTASVAFRSTTPTKNELLVNYIYPVSMAGMSITPEFDLSSLQARLIGLGKDLKELEGNEISSGEDFDVTVKLLVTKAGINSETIVENAKLHVTEFKQQAEPRRIYDACSNTRVISSGSGPLLTGTITLETEIEGKSVKMESSLEVEIVVTDSEAGYGC